MADNSGVQAGGLVDWIREIADPVMPGMTDDTVRARPHVFVGMLLVIVAIALVRYHGGALDTADAQAISVGLGLLGCLGLFWVGHGTAALRAIPRQAWVLLAVSMGLYNLFWYFGRSDAFDRIWLPMLGGGKQDLPMLAWAYFTINNGVVMVGPALLAAWLLYRMTPADLGLWGGGNAHPPVRRIWIVYAVAFAVALPFIVHAGTTQAFVNRYPLYRWAIGPDLMLTVGELLVYEGLYVLSFVFLEAFFRGFLLFSLERGLGLYCLAVMSVPYVCGHFGKPEPEALGAILAGTALGWFALKHRSIWPGVLLHVGMAIIMDTMALLGRGVLVTW